MNRALDRPSSPSTSFPLTETALPEREKARNRALETTAKIDAIESEMARDMLRGLGRSVRHTARGCARRQDHPAGRQGRPPRRSGEATPKNWPSR
ncbi:MAG: hypothetical protein MZW92_48925 [Comamonadaceae bacterium]|nr:hypothetical protein [Comamonadaceae bacterium]